MSCNPNFKNWGSGDCPFNLEEIKMIGFTSYKKEDGTRNQMTTETVALRATHTALLDKYNFDTDNLEKLVLSPIIYNLKAEQGDSTKYENAGYVKKTKDGDYIITFMVEGTNPDVTKQAKFLEDNDVAIYLYDEQGNCGYEKSDTIAYPFRVDVEVQNFKLADNEVPAQFMVTMTLKSSNSINNLWYASMLDGSGNAADIYDETYFYSLNDATGTVTSPATTGCQVVITNNRYGTAVTGSVYGEWTFRDQAAPYTAITLAAAGSITESPSGTYVVNESSLLTSGKTYTCEVRNSGNDIICGDVAVA